MIWQLLLFSVTWFRINLVASAIPKKITTNSSTRGEINSRNSTTIWCCARNFLEWIGLCGDRDKSQLNLLSHSFILCSMAKIKTSGRGFGRSVADQSQERSLRGGLLNRLDSFSFTGEALKVNDFLRAKTIFDNERREKRSRTLLYKNNWSVLGWISRKVWAPFPRRSCEAFFCKGFYPITRVINCRRCWKRFVSSLWMMIITSGTWALGIVRCLFICP